jgi:hypothetical protein
VIESRTGETVCDVLAGAPYRVALTGTIRVTEPTGIQLSVNGARFGHLHISPSVWLRLPWSGYFVAPDTEHGQVVVSWDISAPFGTDEDAPLGIEVRPA